MAKVKRERTIDCVVMGWRPGKEEGTVGSLILGLYDGGNCARSATSPASAPPPNAACGRCWRRLRRRSGTAEASRWTGGRDLEWVAMRPELGDRGRL